MTENYTKVLLITAFVEKAAEAKKIIESSLHLKEFINEDAIIMCADGGFDIAVNLGLTPNIIIGDMDSSKLAASDTSKNIRNLPISLLPVEKDFSDTEAALMALLGEIKVDGLSSSNFQVLILGGLGGRFDHTLANLGLLKRYHHSQGITGNKLHVFGLLDGSNFIQWFEAGTHVLKQELLPTFNSIGFAALEPIKDLSISDLKYPLDSCTLLPLSSLSISNSFIGKSGKITFSEKGLYCIRTP